MAYLEFEIPVLSWTSMEKEILQARLSAIGFEGFAEQEKLIQAYIPEEVFSAGIFKQLLEDMSRTGLQVQYRYHVTPDQNWNEEWEKKFTPVVIAEKVLIRAPFHDSGQDLPCTLVIEPKMSFGTGHHYTTRLMIQAMMETELRGKQVLDMGCGTGVLGIYACLKGACRVLGIDNDQWAYENALENVARNKADAMEVRLGDASALGEEQFDVILANITRNILVRDMPSYVGHLSDEGSLLISGVLTEDVLYVLNAAYEQGLEHLKTKEEDNWISLYFVKATK
jgi:ribosomal protein L11 methyltransferase